MLPLGDISFYTIVMMPWITGLSHLFNANRSLIIRLLFFFAQLLFSTFYTFIHGVVKQDSLDNF